MYQEIHKIYINNHIIGCQYDPGIFFAKHLINNFHSLCSSDRYLAYHLNTSQLTILLLRFMNRVTT